MPATRTLAGVIAAAVTVVIPLAVVAAPVDAAAPKSHVVTAKGKELRGNKFLLVGAVSPRYHYKRVVILKQRGQTGKWQVAGVTKTNDKGIYETRIYGPSGGGTFCWTSRVPATPGYKLSYAKTKACVTVI